MLSSPTKINNSEFASGVVGRTVKHSVSRATVIIELAQTSRKLRALRTVWYRNVQISQASELAVLSQRSMHDR